MKKTKRAKQLTPRQIACRANGRCGGLARAKKLTAAEKRKIASEAGKATHRNHGDDYYAFIARKRKRVGRYSTPVTVGKTKKSSRVK